MKKKWKQIASFLLAAALLLGMIPALSVTTNAEANSGIRGATSANADGVYLSDLEWVSAKHYNDAHGAAFGVQKNHCSEYPWYCDTPGDPSTEQARYPGSGIYMNGDTTAPVLFDYFTKASVKRALSEKELQSLAMQSGLHGDTYPDVETAVTAAKEKANKNDFIFVGGSSFIVADLLKFHV